MSTRLLLEGPDIEAVLTRIADEHGPGARIVAADKIRSGGVGGFFAKEKVQVAIEVDDVANAAKQRPAPAAGDAAGAPASLLDLTAMADAADEAPAALPAPGPARPSIAEAPGADIDGVAATPIFSSLAHQGGEFASVLADLTNASHGAAASRSEVDDVGSSGPTTTPAPAPQAGAVAASSTNGSADSRATTTLDPQVMAELAASFGSPRSFVPAVGTGTSAAPRVEPGAAAVASGRSMTPLQMQADRWLAENFPHLAKGVGRPGEPGPTSERSENVPASVATPEAPTPASTAAPVPAPTTGVTTPAAQVPTPSTDPGRFVPDGAGRGVVGQLVGLGLPRCFAENVEIDAASGLVGGLTRALDAALPAPPSGARHDVLVLVGDGASAYEIGRALARQRRLSPAEVILVAPSDLGTGIGPERHLRSPGELRHRLPELLTPGAPAVVVVDEPVGDCSGRTAAVVDALGDCAVWAVVEATRKPADVSDHLRHLAMVEALVVDGAATTRDPGTVLAVALHHGLPTALLGDRPGDAQAWASMLVSRLQEQS